MPKLVIRGGYAKAQIFELPDGDTRIGRDTESELVLPHTSVSRNHACIRWDGSAVQIKDLGSSNGVVVNDKTVSTMSLSPGDHVRVGDYHLHLIKDDEAFFEGRYIAYMPAYSPTSAATRGATLVFGSDDADAHERAELLIASASVARADDSDQFWYPEDQILTFGGGGMVAVEGFFTGGVVAEVAWVETQHVLRKKKVLVGVSVDGTPIKTDTALSGGERLVIGKTAFVYRTDDA